MKKKVIALADNSYTIRRIVELSFSEIENIEVHSFENGYGLKEKLLKLEPDVVIVDIKLPEISGYDLCRFINETPLLSRSRVFLMKGSFEAVDNEMMKNLKYEDIVTKPFDSNALVNAVVKIIGREEQEINAEFADAEPKSFPEDIIEIKTGSPETEGSSFSDIRLDLEGPASAETDAPQNRALERDEVLPSEEITQGAQPSQDALLAPDNEETIQNPFSEEPLSDDMQLPSGELIKLSATPQKEIKIGPRVDPGVSLRGKINLSGKLEETLTLAIKELIWEIVPSLAEKIIKEEIDKIKSEANDAGF